MTTPRTLALLLTAAVSQLGACALVSRGAALDVRYYTLDDRAAEHAANGKSELTLRLGRIDASGSLGEQIAVRKSAHEISYRDDQRWTEKPAQYVRRELEHALFSERGLARSYSGLTPTLEVELIELELVEAGKQPHARVRLTAQIRDERRNLCQDHFQTQLPLPIEASKQPDPRADMERSVAVLSKALHQTVQQVAARVVQCLSSAEPPAAEKATSRTREPAREEPAADSEALANAE